MLSRFWDLPLRKKISGIYILANVLVFIVNVFLIVGINGMSLEMDMVYQDNRQLNELSDALDDVQDSMTTYLNAKTSDSLEEFYRSDQAYSMLIQEMNTQITDMSYDRMERNIKYMSENYLLIVRQAIEAKRGRNVEKYRVRYESATDMYNYLSNYIIALNREQFAKNSENYNRLSKSFMTFEKISVIVLGAVIVGNVFIIISLVSRIIAPLGELATAADEVAGGNLDAELVKVSSKDEIGVVTNAFNKMVVNIREYIEKQRQSMEVERALKEKELMMETHLKDAQLKYLQAQINPHFLFNTLNAGAQLAMMEGADRTYEYVQTVADFFRYNVKKQDKPVTIGEEVNLVDNYIRILNVRFSGDIHYEKQVDERLLNVEMPSMILQPIVENSVNHGIREMGDKGMIRLKVYRDRDRVCIMIKDNGKGIGPEEIDRILRGKVVLSEDKKESNGIGLDNVIARIRLYTDDPEAVSITCEGEDLGVETIIRIPNTNTENENV
ncbi:MAG: histidine kinase [Lachnospiraceae bacterium]|nr:histidine kinase [Lachnospiraceae bacterium]